METYWRRLQNGSDRYNTYGLGMPELELVALSNFLGSPLAQSLEDLQRLPAEENADWIKKFHILMRQERGLQYWHRARFKDAIGELGSARTAIERLFGADKYCDDIAMIERRSGEIYLYWGNLTAADERTESAMNVTRELDHETSYRASRYLANEFDKLGGIEIAKTESINWYEPMDVRVQRARVLDMSNKPDEAEVLFKEGESLAGKMLGRPHLPYVWLFWYADFLINRDKFDDAKTKARDAIRGDMSKVLLRVVQRFVFEYADVLLRIRESDKAGVPLREEAVRDFEKVVAGLEQAGQLPHMPYGWLAMAKVYQASHQWDKALSTLDEVRTLSRCFEMKLHEADCYMGYADVYYARWKSRDKEPEDLKRAGAHLAEAFQLAGALEYERSIVRLRRLARTIYGAQAEPERPRGFFAFREATEAYAELIKYLKTLPPDRPKMAIMLQHRCVHGYDLTKALLDRPATTVQVFLQHPGAARLIASNRQTEDLVKAADELIDNFKFKRNDPRRNRLTISHYFGPASLCAVNIDDQVLMLGWYTYLHRETEANANRTTGVDSRLGDDLTQVRGHDNASVVVYAHEKEAFQRLNTWFKSHLSELPDMSGEQVDAVGEDPEKAAEDLFGQFAEWFHRKGYLKQAADDPLGDRAS